MVVCVCRQEPGTNEQIKSFVASRAPGVLIAPKSAVNGSESHPLFTVGKAAFPGDCGWNFACRCTFCRGGRYGRARMAAQALPSSPLLTFCCRVGGDVAGALPVFFLFFHSAAIPGWWLVGPCLGCASPLTCRASHPLTPSLRLPQIHWCCSYASRHTPHDPSDPLYDRCPVCAPPPPPSLLIPSPPPILSHSPV